MCHATNQEGRKRLIALPQGHIPAKMQTASGYAATPRNMQQPKTETRPTSLPLQLGGFTSARRLGASRPKVACGCSTDTFCGFGALTLPDPFLSFSLSLSLFLSRRCKQTSQPKALRWFQIMRTGPVKGLYWTMAP